MRVVQSHHLFRLRRYVAAGSSIGYVLRPGSSKPVLFKNRSVKAQLKVLYEDYISGCHNHKDCRRSLYVTPSGVLMVPHALRRM